MVYQKPSQISEQKQLLQPHNTRRHNEPWLVAYSLVPLRSTISGRLLFVLQLQKALIPRSVLTGGVERRLMSEDKITA